MVLPTLQPAPCAIVRNVKRCVRQLLVSGTCQHHRLCDALQRLEPKLSWSMPRNVRALPVEFCSCSEEFRSELGRAPLAKLREIRTAVDWCSLTHEDKVGVGLHSLRRLAHTVL
eukprot:7387188-Prymnesium_polylepis.1